MHNSQFTIHNYSKKHFFYKKMRARLHNPKKSSTFAANLVEEVFFYQISPRKYLI